MEESFFAKDFQNFCELNGIKRQLTTTCTLQWSGMVERMDDDIKKGHTKKSKSVMDDDIIAYNDNA